MGGKNRQVYNGEPDLAAQAAWLERELPRCGDHAERIFIAQRLSRVLRAIANPALRAKLARRNITPAEGAIRREAVGAMLCDGQPRKVVDAYMHIRFGMMPKQTDLLVGAYKRHAEAIP